MPLFTCVACGSKVLCQYYPAKTEVIESVCPKCGHRDKLMCLGESDTQKHYWDVKEYGPLLDKLLGADEGLGDEIDTFDPNDEASCMYDPRYYDIIKQDVEYNFGWSHDVGCKTNNYQHCRKGL